MNVRVLVIALFVALSAQAARAQDAPADTGETPADGDAPQTTDETGTLGRPPPVRQVGVSVKGGPGFALTPDRRAVLHVGIDGGAGFDTNPYSVPFGAEAGEFTGDVAVRVRPNASVDYPGSLLSFRGQAMLDYGFLPGLINPETQEFLLYNSLVGADLEVNRSGAFRFAIGETFSWNSDPGLVTLGDNIFNRIHNQLRAGVGFTPGGGALSTRLVYSFDLTKYLDVNQTGAAINNGALDNMLHTAQLRLDYKFLPRTGFFWNVSAGWSSYPFDGENINPQAFPVTALIGVKGQILAKVAGLASLGYSNPLVVDAGGIVTGGVFGLVGQGELQWQPTPSTRLGGGFQRSFAPAPLYQFLGNNRFYLMANQVLAGRFNLGINTGYSILEFGEEQEDITNLDTGRLDGHLDALINLSYYFNDWFSVGVVDRVDWRLTNADDITSGQNFSFLRNQTFVLASVSY